MTKENKKNRQRLYFMNDKNIHDGLSNFRVKAEHLNEFLLGKGILVPFSATKEVMIEIVKTIRFDYYDYVYLSSILEQKDRRDSQSTTEIPAHCERGTINSAADSVKKICANEEDDIDLKVTNVGKKTIVDVSYVDVDYNKSPMQQRSPKKGTIEIDYSSGTEVSIRFPANDVCKKIKDKLIKEISKSFVNEVKPIEIDFEHSSPELRTEFFTRLISLPDYDVYDVVNVSVRNATGDETGSDVTGQLRKAALSGEGLLSSDTYQSLPSEEYNIYKIVWKIRKINGAAGSNQSDCFSVEARFDDADKSKGFSYQVKAVQRYNTSRRSLNSTSEKTNKSEADIITKLLYKTAVGIYTELVSEE
ncbi:hypothetical protein NTK89_001651 [Vibrio fluvialis]|nr:hypothetical protein [Vibrio fluvialis]